MGFRVYFNDPVRLGMQIAYAAKPHHSVNLAIFTVFRGTVFIDAAPTGLNGLEQTRFYTDTAPTGLKRFLKSSKFPRRIRFGWETEPTGSGDRGGYFFKLTLMVGSKTAPTGSV